MPLKVLLDVGMPPFAFDVNHKSDVLLILGPIVLGCRVVGESTGPWLSHDCRIVLEPAIPPESSIPDADATRLLR